MPAIGQDRSRLAERSAREAVHRGSHHRELCSGLCSRRHIPWHGGTSDAGDVGIPEQRHARVDSHGTGDVFGACEQSDACADSNVAREHLHAHEFKHYRSAFIFVGRPANTGSANRCGYADRSHHA